MDVAGSAVGIISLGIQVCQGLLSYYDSWKDYKDDITETHKCITSLCRTFTLLQESLRRDGLDPERVKRVQESLDSCVDSLSKLQKKLHKIQTHSTPIGLRQRAWTEIQRTLYPFRQSTLMKLRELVDELQDQLSLAIQILHLDLTASSHQTLTQIEVHVKDTATNVQNLLSAQQKDQFRKLVDWLAPPDPWTNHATARQHHEPNTGMWLLQSDQYTRWKGGQSRHLWLHGKAGCGKTILNFTVVEDLKQHCDNNDYIGLAVFYFSFTDGRKQSVEDFLRSMVAQLAWKEPARSMLQREYDKPNRTKPGLELLEEVLIISASQYHQVFAALDALDECPETDDARQRLLDSLQRLSEKASNLKIFATSRVMRDIQEGMVSLEMDVVQANTSSVDVDIMRYVRSEISRDRKLRGLNEETKQLIQDTFAEKADGMFRWAFLQLRQLKTLKSMRPHIIKDALTSLPPTLDATYERMLTAIEERYRPEALAALRWLVFAKEPLKLAEIAETGIIDVSGTGRVDLDNRGTLEDVPDILAGLIIFEQSWNYKDHWIDELVEPGERRLVGWELISLAHFSVQEYLVGTRILTGGAKNFHLERVICDGFLRRSCLIYLFEYFQNPLKTSKFEDLETFPLLEYAAENWWYHLASSDITPDSLEIRLLDSPCWTREWLTVYNPDHRFMKFHHDNTLHIGSGLYYASRLDLGPEANVLLSLGANVDSFGGFHGTALSAAAHGGFINMINKLLDNGASINLRGGLYDDDALCGAIVQGRYDTARLLIKRGASPGSNEDFRNSALYCAILEGPEMVKLLVDAGFEIKPGALHTALWYGERGGILVEMLLDAGADVNAYYDNATALQIAARTGRTSDVRFLLERGADVHATGRAYGKALKAASAGGHSEIAELLKQYGAVVDDADDVVRSR